MTLLGLLTPNVEAVIAPDPGPVTGSQTSVSPACQIYVDTKNDPEGIKANQCEKDTPAGCKSYSRPSDPKEYNASNPKDPKEVAFRNCLLGQTKEDVLSKNPIVKDINTIVKFLSGLVAVVITGALILGGIQYSLAGDKAEAVAAAKKRIINALIALIVFILIFTFLQWLIPGGIFS